MLERRQPHTHATCGFCLRPNIIRSKPHEECPAFAALPTLQVMGAL